MSLDPIVTREIASFPKRSLDAHKGDVGRIMIVGGCAGEVTMVGAPALAANAALRCGAGLVAVVVPDEIQAAVLALAPCATARRLNPEPTALAQIIRAFGADVLAVGPGLGDSLTASTLAHLLTSFTGPIVVDADGLNLLASAPPFEMADPARVVLTPHPGEAARLLAGRGITSTTVGDKSPQARRRTALDLVGAYGCAVVLKGRGTVVANRERVYVNESGNAGMASAGTGDVLTGMIAALLGQRMDTLEAAILGTHLHGLAGDFAAEEFGRVALIATDLIEFLPEAIADHDSYNQE